MSDIRTIIKQELARKGPISFARFMELALYCPNFGYYEHLDVSPGQKGDFFTSVSVGSLFGELLAYQFAEWLGTIPARPWHILEAGVHEGLLAGDILRWLQAHRPDISGSFEYWILEPSARRRCSQEKSLGNLSGSVRWFDSWSALPPTGINGFIFSNELLDAMPVHRLGWDAANKRWFEWGVKVKEDDFVWIKMPVEQGGKIRGFAQELPQELLAVLPDGFTTEICPAAIDWWQSAANALKAGKLIAFDYGMTADQFFTPERKAGTLRAYYRHHQTDELLARVGKQDITAQVNFTAILEAGESAGLRTEGLLTQAQFLTGVMAQMSKNSPHLKPWTSTQVRQFQTLTHPEHLGNSFRVLVQSR